MHRLIVTFLIQLIYFTVSASLLFAQESPSQSFIPNPIALHVTVTEADGRYVTSLGKTAFTIYDNKTQLEISSIDAQDVPLSVGIIFDMSGSMLGGEGRSSDIAKAKLLEFVQLSNGLNQYFVIGFDQRPHVLTDWTDKQSVIAEGLSNLVSKERVPLTALYDAFYLGLEKVTQGKYSKRIILLITDGIDNVSRYKASDVKSLLKEKDVLVYSIRVNPPATNHIIEEASPVLNEWSSISGGKAYFTHPLVSTNHTQSEINRRTLFEVSNFILRIAVELRSQYTIRFMPTSSNQNGEWHRIKIKAIPPRGFSKTTVRSRAGYYQR